MSFNMWKHHGLKDREKIAKAYLVEGSTSDLNAGGRLDPEVQEAAFQFMRAQSTLLSPKLSAQWQPQGPSAFYPPNAPSTYPNVAFPTGGLPPSAVGGPGIDFIVHRGGKMSGRVENTFAGGTVMRPATEFTAHPGPATKPLSMRVSNEWQLKKMQTFITFSKEMVYQTFYEDRFQDLLMSRVMPLMVNDLEQLALLGDDDVVPTDDRTALISANDGWLKQMRARSTRIHFDGNYVELPLFFEMMRSFPKLYMPREKYFFCNPAVILDWIQAMSLRAGGALEASMALTGAAPAPLGVQFWPIPLLPTDDAINTITTAVPGRALGTKADYFKFPTDGYQISLNVDGAGATVVTFPHVNDASLMDRQISAQRVANIINDTLVADHGSAYRSVARVDQFGRIELVSPTDGAGSSIVVAAGAANGLPTLGLSANTYSGANAGAGNTLYQGTSLFLTTPANLQWRVSVAAPDSGEGGFQQYLKYEQETDSYRYDAYSWHDFTLVEHSAAVLVDGLRVAVGDQSPPAPSP